MVENLPDTCPQVVLVEKFEKDSSVLGNKNQGLWRCGCFRLGIALLLLCCVLVNGLMRSDLSMAIVCMVNSSAMHEMDWDNTSISKCDQPSGIDQQYDGTFMWTHKQQALLFSSSFWGGMVTTLFAGWFADRYGAKNIMLIAALTCSTSTLLTPTMAVYADFIGLFIIRFILGIGEGLMIPSIASMIARWFPPNERSTVIALYTAGNQIALVLCMPISAGLCQNHSILGGWPAIFYLFGSLTLIWCCLWIRYGSNSAEKSTKISNEEKNHIIMHLQDQNMQGARKDAMSQIPWTRIVVSVPLWCNMLSNYMAALVMFTISTQIPTYFKQVLSLNLKDNGFYSAVPFIFQLISKGTFAVLADSLKRRNAFSHTTICKIFNTIHAVGPLVFLLPLGYVDCTQPKLALSLLCATCMCMSGAIPGWMTSLHGIAPTYSGTINSIAKITGQFGAFSGPIYASYLTPNGTQAEWRSVFISLGAMLSASGLIFAIFGSADIQPWAMVSKQSQVTLVVEESVNIVEDP